MLGEYQQNCLTYHYCVAPLQLTENLSTEEDLLIERASPQLDYSLPSLCRENLLWLCCRHATAMYNIPTAFSLLLPVPLTSCFTWQSHRIPHETGLSLEVIFLASIPEWQTAGGNCRSWNIFAETTDPAQQGCSVLAAHLLLILWLQGCAWCL